MLDICGMKYCCTFMHAQGTLYSKNLAFGRLTFDFRKLSHSDKKNTRFCWRKQLFKFSFWKGGCTISFELQMSKVKWESKSYNPSMTCIILTDHWSFLTFLQLKCYNLFITIELYKCVKPYIKYLRYNVFAHRYHMDSNFH